MALKTRISCKAVKLVLSRFALNADGDVRAPSTTGLVVSMVIYFRKFPSVASFGMAALGFND